MLNLLSRIADIIVQLVTYLVHSITTFVNLLSKIPTFIVFLTDSIGNFIPDIFKPFALASIAISVVYLVVGRK